MKLGWFGAMALAVYLAATCFRLDALPPVGDDEGWIASSSFKLASAGVYGSDLLAGYFGSERHTFHHLPLYPLLQALVFKVAGVGVGSMRALSVASGAVVLLLVFLIGRELAGNRCGVAAAFLLLTLRVGGAGSGVPLLDSARVARYDVTVPAFGLLAVWVYLRFGASTAGAAATGFLVGLSSLCHVYGAFTLPVLLALAAARGARRTLLPLVGGFVLPWLPCVAYAAAHSNDFLGQLRRWDGGFDLTSPAAYLYNIAREPSRYGSLLAGSGGLPWLRPGLVTACLSLPLACVAAWRERERNPMASTVAALLAGEVALFALLLRVKTFSYVIALWPLAVLLIAWVGVRLWDARRGAFRLGLAAALCVIASEGAFATATRLAASATSYEAFESRLRAVIPSATRVLLLPRFWLGLPDRECRSWTLPSFLAEARYSERALGYDAAFDAIAPDVIVVDSDMRRFLEAAASPTHERHAAYVAFESYRGRRGMTRPETIEDPTYGRIEVYVAPSLAR